MPDYGLLAQQYGGQALGGAPSSGAVPSVGPHPSGHYADLAAQFGGQSIGTNTGLGQLQQDTSQEAQTNDHKSVGGFIGNIFSSGANAIGNIAEAVAHPINTVSNLGKVAAGGVEKLIPGQQGQEQNFDNVINFFKNRYGGLDKTLNTAYNDPVGFAFDVASLLTGAGAPLKAAGVAGKLSDFAQIPAEAERAAEVSRFAKAGGFGSAAKVGENLVTAGNLVDPFSLAAKGVSPATSRVSEGIQNLPGKLTNSAVGTSKLFEEAGRAPGEFIAEQGHVGTKTQLLNQFQSNIDRLNLAIDKKLAQSDYVVNSQEVLSRAKQDFVQKYPGQYSPEQVDKLFKKLPINELKANEQVAAKVANQLRVSLDKSLPVKAYLTDTKLLASREAQKSVANTLRDVIQKNTGTSQEFSDLANYINAKKSLANKSTTIGLKDLVIGGAAEAVGGPHLGLPVFIGKQVAKSSLAKTLAAQGVRRGVNAAEAVGSTKAFQALTSGPTRRALFQAGNVNKSQKSK